MSDFFYRPQIATIPLLQAEEPSATMDRSRSVDPDKLKKVIKTLLNMPDMKVPQAMLSAKILRQGGCRSLLASVHPAISPWQNIEGLEGACVRSSSATTAAT